MTRPSQLGDVRGVLTACVDATYAVLAKGILNQIQSALACCLLGFRGDLDQDRIVARIC
jgi:hypothetical protein